MNEATWTRTRKTKCWGSPPVFCSDEEAIAWAITQEAFANYQEARAAFDAVATLQGKWARWIGVTGKRLEGKCAH